ncbi:SOS response-associated peptidase [Thalassospira sp. NFXS8]|uniref:SOS response-associated peptidase n=1 Tax=Thalassospira sp. NFXS8 TaxID=2819093 RepID=UPI0032DFBA87
MCSRFDLNTDIRAFQARLALDMAEMIRQRPLPLSPATRQNRIKHNDDPAPSAKSADHKNHVDQTNPKAPQKTAQDKSATDISEDGASNETGDNLENSGFNGLSGIKRPTDPIAVIIPAWSLSLRKWGLARHDGAANMAKSQAAKGLLINARAETLAQKRTFRPLLQRRCLIPATGWFEWRKNGQNRYKNHITLPNHAPFLFAGLENGDDVVIITCPPSPVIRHIHNRMPAIIGPGHIHKWLDQQQDFSAVRHMLHPVPNHLLAWNEEPQAGSAHTPSSPISDNQFDLF